MKILGIILLIAGVVTAAPAVRQIIDGGLGENSGEQTRALVGLAIPALFLFAGFFLTFKK